MLAALASDLALRNGVLQSTFLDLTSGNQLFLKSILALAGQRDDRGKKKKKENKDLQQEQVTEEAIREALFGPWQYRDDHHSLGWDPQTQRLHALRHKLPEQDKANRSVRIAVFLASQALPIFPCFVTDHGRFRTTGFFRENGEDWFSWPIWRVPITLETLRSLVTHPFTADLK